MSYVIIDEASQQIGTRVENPILTPLEPGQRISFLLVVAVQGNMFRCTVGTAEGEVRRNSSHGGSVVSIIGTNIQDVVEVRRRLFEAMGMTDVSPRLPLPSLARRIERLKYLIDYIWTGKV